MSKFLNSRLITVDTPSHHYLYMPSASVIYTNCLNCGQVGNDHIRKIIPGYPNTLELMCDEKSNAPVSMATPQDFDSAYFRCYYLASVTTRQELLK